MNITDKLKEPFHPNVIHWRVGATNKDKTSGLALAFVNARDVMKRFDDVCGDLWQVEYPFAGCCRIGIKIDSEWIWRSNGAGETQVEGEKGIYSDAFKRAAVLWGPGRYLYYLPQVWCPLDGYKKIIKPPKLPDWAIPIDKAYIALVKSNQDTINVVKQGIVENDLSTASEAWYELSEETQIGLWKATAKGGCFTTREREIIKSTEFRVANK